MPKPTSNRQTLRTIDRLVSQLDDDMLLALLDDNSEDDDNLAQRFQQKLTHELSQQDEFRQVQTQMQDTVLSLADYLNAVQVVISETFAHSVWVKAEIRNLSTKGGHYYFELADKDEAGKITASCRGNLWRGQATKILTKFEKNTGMRLDRGLNVLLKVTASFHSQYGFAVTILDIDPTFTIGDLAQQYQQMLEQLMKKGLLDLNKSLPMPFDIQNVLVIAPENAAGLGDFRADADRLDKTGACQFHYATATFQGNHAPQEIRHAIRTGLKNLQNQEIIPELVVIIRGGGAVGDLAYLNDYELAALVAELPVPVWVGIGHERDHVILDNVAHISFDTPSKVIAGIRNHLIDVTQTAKQAFLSIEKMAKNQLSLAQRDNEQALMRLESQAKQQIIHAKNSINQQLSLTKQQSFYKIQLAKQHTEQMRTIILLQHPTAVMTRGYAVVRNYSPDGNGRIFTSINQISEHQTIMVEMQDGKFEAKVMLIEEN